MLYDEIQNIKQWSGPVLSIYLNTSRSSDRWKIEVKNEFRLLDTFMQKTADKGSYKEYEMLKERALETMNDYQPKMKRSFVAFITKEQKVVKNLQVPVETKFYYSEKSETYLLESLYAKTPASGVIHLQWDRVMVLHNVLGEIEEEVNYLFDIEKENWRQFIGLAYGGIISSSANHRDKYERRVKENQIRWLKEILPQIKQYAVEKKWDGIYLAGQKELISEAEKVLQLPIYNTIPQLLAGKNSAEILKILTEDN